MTEADLYPIILWAWLAVAGGAFAALMFKTAPYGRFARAGWGFRVPPRLAWLLMESPASIVFTLLFVVGETKNSPAIAFLLIWNSHYIYRGFVYPALKRSDRGVPVSIVAAAFGFQLINSYVQARFLFTISPPYPPSWLLDPRFIVGVVLFAVGWTITVQSDTLLRRLRASNPHEYKIPRGGMFRWVSCPNYLGELIEWSAWTLLTWSMAGLVFALWTAANLVPRALAYHRWYREEFSDYPPERKAVVPFVL